MTTVVNTCVHCWGPQEQQLVDCSTYGGGPEFVLGRWEPCGRCGATTEPMVVRAARPVGAIHGPDVPTPADILVAAGLQAYARHPHQMGA